MSLISSNMFLKNGIIIVKCTVYNFKVILEEKILKSWLKSISAFVNGLVASLFFHDGNETEIKLTEHQQKILKFIKEFPITSDRQISEILSISQPTVE